MGLFRKLPALIVALAVAIIAAAFIVDGAALLGIGADTADLARGSFLLTLLRALVFNAFLFFVLRVFDLMCGREDFGGWIREARENGNFRAVSTYYGARIIAVALGNGLIFS